MNKQDQERIFQLVTRKVSDTFILADIPFIIVAELGEGGLAVCSNMNDEGVKEMLKEVSDQAQAGMLTDDKKTGEAAAPTTSGNTN